MGYLILSKENKITTREEYHLISSAKLIRDRKAHELYNEEEKSKLLATFIAGINVILKLSDKIKSLDKLE